MDFTAYRLNPYATTPPHVIRTTTIPYLANYSYNNTSFTEVPLVDAATWFA